LRNRKPNIQCQKCGYQWHTTSRLKKVSCPSCNQKTSNTTLLSLVKQLVRHKRAIIGLEAAIVLIAFVIIAAAFSFMVINQGLFATERGKTVIQEGLKQASTPLTVDGTTFTRTDPSGETVNVIIIPVRAFGVKYVAMGRNETVVTLKIGRQTWANAYCGVLYNKNNTDETYNPDGKKFDDFVGFTFNAASGRYVDGSYNGGNNVTGAILAISHSNGDESLDSGEKGFLIITLANEDAASSRDEINVELRLEKSCTLSLEFSIPESMPPDTYVPA